MHRAHLLLAYALVAFAAPIQALADGAPIPAEPGEWYLTLRAGQMEFERSAFRSQQQYVDDSIVRPDGLVSLINPQDFLVNLKLATQREWLPEIEFGRALVDSPLAGRFDGSVRVAVSASYHEFKSSAAADSLTPIGSGIFIDDGMGGTVETGLIASYNAIDGSNNGTIQAGFLDTAEITDVRLSTEMTQGGAEFMLYFDERWKGWELSRGAGLSYTFQDEQMKYSFTMPALALDDPSMGLMGNYDFIYDYDIQAHIIGLKVGFAIGRPLIGGLGLFVNGSVTPGFAIGQLDAVQSAPCQTFTSCTVPGLLDRDTIRHSKSETKFAYKIRAGAGLTWRVWKLRITGQAGIRHGRTHYEARANSGARPVRIQLGTSTGFWANLGLTFVL